MARNYIKGKDFGELFFFAFVPAVAIYYFGKKGYDFGGNKLGVNKEELLDLYANAMIKRYLEYYMKKKTVSPQAIR